MFMSPLSDGCKKAALALVFTFTLVAGVYSLPVTAQFAAGGGEDVEEEVEHEVDEQGEEQPLGDEHGSARVERMREQG